MSITIISTFYTAFAKKDSDTMAELYHEDLIFNDPVFRNLSKQEATGMWEMLLKNSKGNLSIIHHSAEQKAEVQTCVWEARYSFSKTGRSVHNIISSRIEIKNNLIIRHTDHFPFWKWSRMALGTPGYLLGWTPFLRNKVRKTANNSLKKYLKNRN